MPRTVEMKNGSVIIIDQTLLPKRLKTVELNTVEEVAAAIKNMRVRGAPAIGVAAALGMAVAASRSRARSKGEFLRELEKARRILGHTRPTAVNLFWALSRVMRKAESMDGDVDEVKRIVIECAQDLAEEDYEVNRILGRVGAPLLGDGDTVLTHCNAGSLATVGYGTALGVVRAAIEGGKQIKVFATETRPRLQGARLTAFELMYDGIPVTLITDGMAAHVMSRGLVSKIVVGADRILRTGHVVNKIGTLSLAVTSNYYGVPFYVAAPSSTIDLETAVEKVIIEERGEGEVRFVEKCQVAPSDVPVMNPAFDVTPPQLVKKIITEKGLIEPPFEENITMIMDSRGPL